MRQSLRRISKLETELERDPIAVSRSVSSMVMRLKLALKLGLKLGLKVRLKLRLKVRLKVCDGLEIDLESQP